MIIEKIAKICHEVNKVYCESIGDFTQVTWDEAPDWQKKSAIDGVNYHSNNLDAKPSDSHNNWMTDKEADGWKYGEVKDATKKEHPCMVPYEELPKEQQFKDTLFMTIIKSIWH